MTQGNQESAPGGSAEPPAEGRPPSVRQGPKEVPNPDSSGLGTLSVWMILLIVFLSLALRVVYVLRTGAELEFPDEKQYLNIAENFLKGEGLSVSIDSETGALLHVPLEMHRMPMYPLVLALITKAVPGLTGVRLIQALMGALTCVMIYLLAAELVGERAGRVAGLIASIDPFSIYFAGRVLSETLFLLILVAGWYYVVRTWKELTGGAGTTRWLASSLVAGLLGAAAVLTRSTALPLFLLVPLAWLVVGPRRIQGFCAGLLILWVLAVGLSPWVARNYKRTWTKETGGRLVVTTLNVGESLYEAVGPFATGGPNKENTAWPVETEISLQDEYARNRFLVEKSLTYMKNSPFRTLRLAGKKFIRTWNVIPNYENVRTPFYEAVSLASYVPVLLAGILGLLVSLRGSPNAMNRAWGPRVRVLVWLLLPVVVFTLVHMVFVGSVRYRLPMMPFVMVLSGVGVWWLVSKVFKRTRGTVEHNEGPQSR